MRYLSVLFLLLLLLACEKRKQIINKGETVIDGQPAHFEEFLQNDSFYHIVTIPGKGYAHLVAASEKDFRDSTFSEKIFVKSGRLVQQKNFRSGTPHGEWTNWSDNGQTLSWTRIVDGLAHEYKAWYPDGQLRVEGKRLQNGSMVRTEYFPGGKPSQEFRVDSAGNGSCMIYFPSGKLREMGNLSNYAPTGSWKRFDSLSQPLPDTLYGPDEKP
jgi:antitoxin component YwqK of YwqJK toxin-antitoxin module